MTVYGYNNETGKKVIYYVEDLDGSRKVYASFDAGDDMYLTKEDQMPIDGFTYKEWHQNSDRNGRDLWLYYTRNSYTITFQNCTGVNGLSVKFEAPLNNLKPADGSVGTPANVESDYTFAGWYTSPSCEDGTEFDWSGTMSSHTITLYAKWQAPIYTVTFETNTVTEQDVLAGKIVNVATVKGTGENGRTVENETIKELVTEQINSHLTVIKTTTSTPADGKAYSAGETEDPVNPEVTPTVTPKPSTTPAPDITQAPAATKNSSNPSTPVNNGTTTKTAVKTGDTTPVGAFAGLFAAAAIVAGAAVYFKRRKRDK